jgi:hypothetical protein
MRKYLWLSPILFVALGSVPARADIDFSYDIHFTCDAKTPGCLLPTFGTFTYDSTTHTFTNFEVDWDGIATDLVSAANAGPSVVGSQACLNGKTGAAASFLVMTGCPFDLYEPWLANTGGQFAFSESTDVNNYSSFRAAIPGLPAGAPQAFGNFTLTPIPEPNALILLSTSLLVLTFVSKMRFARRQTK